MTKIASYKLKSPHMRNLKSILSSFRCVSLNRIYTTNQNPKRILSDRLLAHKDIIWWVGIAMASTLVFMAIFATDFITFVLALEAEYMRSTAKVATGSNYSYCVYSSDIATKLGIIAFVLLLASQVFSMGASSYFRKGMNYGGNRTSAVIPSIISWITFFIAEACLLGGSIKNAQQTKFRSILVTNELHCQTLSAGVFEAGAVFILITSIVSKMSYVCSFNSDGGFETGSSSSFELGTYTSLNQGDQHD